MPGNPVRAIPAKVPSNLASNHRPDYYVDLDVHQSTYLQPFLSAHLEAALSLNRHSRNHTSNVWSTDHGSNCGPRGSSGAPTISLKVPRALSCTWLQSHQTADLASATPTTSLQCTLRCWQRPPLDTTSQPAQRWKFLSAEISPQNVPSNRHTLIQAYNDHGESGNMILAKELSEAIWIYLRK